MSDIQPANESRRLVCARCGAAFDCRLGGECWCAAEPVRLPMPEPGAADDCLCPACLRAAAQCGAGASNEAALD